MSDAKEVLRGKFVVINTYNIKNTKISNKQPTFTILFLISHRALLPEMMQESGLIRRFVHLSCVGHSYQLSTFSEL
jgi:hypothetical protein